jgi:peptidyl-Asp metalloendopeptidase
MARLSISALLIGLVALCGCTSGTNDGERGALSHVGSAAQARAPLYRPGVRPAIASLPDHGDLLRYDSVRRIEPGAPYTSYPVTLSEAHAFNALHGGELVVAVPGGERLRFRTQRHEEHADGNWTLVSRDGSGANALLTFGQDAVFGSIARADGSVLRVTTRNRQVYLVAADPRQLARFENPGEHERTDMLLPPVDAAQVLRSAPATASDAASAQTATEAGKAAANVVDVLAGYTTGLAARIGSDSGAVTRMQNLVAITNQAYGSSGVAMRLRLVRTLAVNYTDHNPNETALEGLTGSSGTGPVPVDPAFSALRAAREESGADLVSLVRQFRDPENEGCGIAWLLGGRQSAITQQQASFAYSVVSDGSDVRESDGRTYLCRNETFAHELGHNMGQAHNQENADFPGAHAYSYGYREASQTGFYTVMAYRIPDSRQVAIRYFANPAVTDADTGRPTGVVGQSDNVRSMNQTMPIIASFRASVVASAVGGALVGLNGKCVDAAGRGTANGTPLQMWTCNFEPQQLWGWNPFDAASPIVGAGSGRVIDVEGYGTANGARLQLWDGANTPNQRWSMANFAIVGVGSGRVLDALGVSSANGTKIQLYDNLGGSNQIWNFNAGDRSIRGIGGKCLDVTGFGTSNGTPVQLWSCNGTPNQRWEIGANGSIVGYAGKCLEAADGLNGNGTTVRMWDCNGGAHQAWRLLGEVRSLASNRCLDDSGNGNFNGARVQIWDCHGGGNQRWLFGW